MPSASSLFVLFSISENSLLEIFSELHENIRGIFIRQDEELDQRVAWEPPRGQGDPWSRPHRDLWVGPAPALWWSPRPPLTPINTYLPQFYQGGDYFLQTPPEAATTSKPNSGRF